MTDVFCDICRLPCREGQGMFGGIGNGDRFGPKRPDRRHYDCHVGKFGRTGDISQFRKPVEQPGQPIKRPTVTKGKHNYSPNASRSFKVLSTIREMGKTRVKIECPFCNHRFMAFVWSIAGRGKKCTNCGAMHSSFGEAYPLEGNEDL